MSCQAPPALDELTLAAGKQPTNVPAPRYVTHCAREHGAGLSLCRPPFSFRFRAIFLPAILREPGCQAGKFS